MTLWEKMQAASTTSTPEFASTHPSSSTRIAQLQKDIPQVKATFGGVATQAQTKTTQKTSKVKASGKGYTIGK